MDFHERLEHVRDLDLHPSAMDFAFDKRVHELDSDSATGEKHIEQTASTLEACDDFFADLEPIEFLGDDFSGYHVGTHPRIMKP